MGGLDRGHALSRRNIVKGAAGVALAAQATTVEPGALAPSVVNLADAATIAVDASAGNDFRVTIAGNRTMGTPANPTNGQQVIFQVTQGAGGPFTLAWSSGYEFSASLPRPTLSGGTGQLDILAFSYHAAKGSWLFVGAVNGFS